MMELKKLKQIIKEEVENLNNDGSIIDKIINSGNFKYSVGSGSYSTSNPTKETILEFMKQLMQHELFDQDFFYNWAGSDKGKWEYFKAFQEEIEKPLMANPDEFFNKYVGQIHPYREARDTSYGIRPGFNSREFINNYFITSKLLSQELKDRYNHYRWTYAGEKVDPNHYDYLFSDNPKFTNSATFGSVRRK